MQTFFNPKRQCLPQSQSLSAQRPAGSLAAQSKEMKYIHDTVPEFRSVSISTTPYDHRLLDALVQKRPPVFFAHRFFFVAPAAGELTTMTALAALIRQSERSGGDAV